MSAYNHDVAMYGHAKRNTPVVVIDQTTGRTLHGLLVAWYPPARYAARVQHANGNRATYHLTTHTVEIA